MKEITIELNYYDIEKLEKLIGHDFRAIRSPSVNWEPYKNRYTSTSFEIEIDLSPPINHDDSWDHLDPDDGIRNFFEFSSSQYSKHLVDFYSIEIDIERKKHLNYGYWKHESNPRINGFINFDEDFVISEISVFSHKETRANFEELIHINYDAGILFTGKEKKECLFLLSDTIIGDCEIIFDSKKIEIEISRLKLRKTLGNKT
ncbi:hypothetical protein [Tenacibaculum ovolyticum]|uniref:hypothetical protein n=1 Tax=Tenacibaculum ovolyticum TaxID=104270 RepID=UPI0004194F31|nr:hypothetical protein [Tenacibaculum ovolyticum]